MGDTDRDEFEELERMCRQLVHDVRAAVDEARGPRRHSTFHALFGAKIQLEEAWKASRAILDDIEREFGPRKTENR